MVCLGFRAMVSPAELAALSVYVTVMGVMMAMPFYTKPYLVYCRWSDFLCHIRRPIAAAGNAVFIRLPLALSGYLTYYLGQYLLVAGAARESRP